jgi:nitroreductase
MDLMEAIKKRVSVRNFTKKQISDEIITEMLEAARLALSGGNGQNWVFGIVKDAKLKKQLAHAAGNQMWIASAPVVFACCADISWDSKGLPEDDFGLIVNKLRWGTGYDVVVMAGNILINIETDTDYAEAQRIFISKAAAALRSGGHLYMDYDQHSDDSAKKTFNGLGESSYFTGTDDSSSSPVLCTGERKQRKRYLR